MMVNFIVNERIAISVEKTEGIARFYVYNGDWYGAIDWDSRTFYCDRNPENIQTIESIRPITGKHPEWYM